MKYILFFIILAGCATVQNPVSSAPFKVSWESGHPERKPWTDVTAEMVETNLSVFDGAKDVAAFCPNYKLLSITARINVWSEMVSAISKFESNWKPTTDYKESTGQYSRGLLQMSYGDSYDDCPESISAGDLHDPIVNLKCGISAMVKLIKRDGVIVGSGSSPYAGLCRYWSTSRLSHHLKEIQAMTKKVPGC